MRKLLHILGFKIKTKPKDQTVYDILIEGKSRIQRGWNHNGFYAADRSGNCVPSNSSAAVCWCMTGAIGDDLYNPAERPAIKEAYWLLRNAVVKLYEPHLTGLTTWNDRHANLEQVIAAFDEAIANA